MTEDGVECEREPETQDGANEERREDGLLLPLHLKGWSGQKVGCNSDESNKTYRWTNEYNIVVKPANVY